MTTNQSLSPTAKAVMDAWWNCSQSNQHGIAATLRAVANQPQEVPEYVQGESYWPYVNGLEAMQAFLERIADELEQQ
jgi:hypothetical protein